MKRWIVLLILGIFFITFLGCRTIDKISRVGTGNINPVDVWVAFLDDGRDFQENYW